MCQVTPGHIRCIDTITRHQETAENKLKPKPRNVNFELPYCYFPRANLNIRLKFMLPDEIKLGYTVEMGLV